MDETGKALSVLRETIGDRNVQVVETKGVDDTVYHMDWRRDNGWTTLEGLLGISRNTSISLYEALQQAAFMLCVDVIAQDISKATLRMYERLPSGANRVVDPGEHPIAAILANEPNEWHLWDEFNEMTVRHLVTSSDAYIAHQKTRKGETTALIPIMPQRVVKFVDVSSGEFFYFVSRGSNFELVSLKDFSNPMPAEFMINIRSRFYDGLNGVSTMSLGAKTLKLSESIKEYQTRLYSNDAREAGVITVKGAGLSNDAALRLRAQLTKGWQNLIKNNEPLILEGDGSDFQSVTMSAADAEIAKVADSTISDACRLTRVPPHKVMHLTAIKYENLDAMERVYASDTLVPLARRVEKRLAHSLLTPKERTRFYIEFDRQEMIAVDLKTRAEIATRAWERGGLRMNEYRRNIGENPIDGALGQAFMVPVNMAMIDDSGKILIQPANRSDVPQGVDAPKVPNVPAQPAKPPAKDAENVVSFAKGASK